MYETKNKKMLITAFANEAPASHNLDPQQCAQKLSTFVTDNELDGVNIEWRDEHSFYSQTG